MSQPSYESLLEQYPQLASEDSGIPPRMERFYIPMFREFSRKYGLASRELSVLDCGCGNGVSVELLRRAGFRAYGIDNWAVRPVQWRHRGPANGGCCLTGHALRLPFQDGCFDIVISCGLLEHIGVLEQWEPRYSVRPLEDQFACRTRFVGECLRVLRRPGLLIIDHPNGSFPVDFWHDNQRFGGRWNRREEGFLPTYGEVQKLLQAAGFQGSVQAISPAGRFTFQQARRRWWGRLLADPLERYFGLMRTPGFRWLAGSALNPYLVVRADL